jgi:alanyl-tRNA synthetase
LTERLYYADSYQCQFEAIVTETLSWRGQPAIVLSRSAFYPTSGGQPHDTGRLQGMFVLDVVERETDKAVIHVLEQELLGSVHLEPGSKIVTGKVNWPRRFDHMQQHTGQHILSQVAKQLLQAATVGFHLGEEVSTVDLDRAPLNTAQLDQLETKANRIIFENRPVVARFVSQDELVNLPLRKPPKTSGPIRIVEIQNFDWSPCGGTHVRATGEVGSIKIVRAERQGNETRLEFLCGHRALTDYRIKNRLLLGLANRFSVGYWQLDEAIERLEEEARTQRKAAQTAQARLLDLEAQQFASQAKALGEFLLVSYVFSNRTLEDVKNLALKLATNHSCVALLGLAGDKGHLVFAAPPDSTCDLRPILRQACAVIGGSGGGRPHLAQGGGPIGSLSSIQEALDVAVQMVRNKDVAR